MAVEPQAGVAPDQGPVANEGSYVDWPAILGGAVAAAAISLVLMTFGSAIGLTLTDPLGGEGVSLFWMAIAVAIWVVWVQVSSFMIGGYLTGRMRRRHFDSNEHEVDVRDGIHGLLVWATGLVISAVLAFGGIGFLAQGLGQATGAAIGAAANGEGDGASPFDYTIDLLFRTPQPGAENPEAARMEAARILVGGITGDGVSEDDRAYLASVVASRTDLNQEQAQARVDEVIARAQTVQADIVEAAEQARRIAILVAFLTAASLAVSAAGAYFAAGMGGTHRDKHTIVAFFNRRVR